MNIDSTQISNLKQLTCAVTSNYEYEFFQMKKNV